MSDLRWLARNYPVLTAVSAIGVLAVLVQVAFFVWAVL